MFWSLVGLTWNWWTVYEETYLLLFVLHTVVTFDLASFTHHEASGYAYDHPPWMTLTDYLLATLFLCCWKNIFKELPSLGISLHDTYRKLTYSYGNVHKLKHFFKKKTEVSSNIQSNLINLWKLIKLFHRKISQINGTYINLKY